MPHRHEGNAMKRKQNSNYVIVKKNGVYIASCPDLDLECRGATEQDAV